MSKVCKKPMCDCGGELFIYTEEVHKLYRKINQNGKPSQKVVDTNDGDNNVYERLRCNECGMAWNIGLMRMIKEELSRMVFLILDEILVLFRLENFK